MNKTASRAFAATEWIMRFAYVNLLWIGFTFLGVVVLGFFPATVAMFTVIRKWIMGETDIPVFQTFWTTYKSEFIRSNGLGLLIVIVGGLIVLNLVFIRNSGDSFTNMIQIPLYMFMFVVILTMFYLLPVYVHYELKLRQIIKNSFLLMIINPIENLVMISGVVAAYFVVRYVPGLGFFFGGSLTAGIIMGTCYLVFNKMDKKKQQT
jgi:uncharacterized membrane protein YesL